MRFMWIKKLKFLVLIKDFETYCQQEKKGKYTYLTDSFVYSECSLPRHTSHSIFANLEIFNPFCEAAEAFARVECFGEISI